MTSDKAVSEEAPRPVRDEGAPGGPLVVDLRGTCSNTTMLSS